MFFSLLVLLLALYLWSKSCSLYWNFYGNQIWHLIKSNKIESFFFTSQLPSLILASRMLLTVTGEVLSYSLLSGGPEADPGVQTGGFLSHHPAVGCHYFPLGLRSPSVLENYAFPILLILYTVLLLDLYFLSKSCVWYSNFYGNWYIVYTEQLAAAVCRAMSELSTTEPHVWSRVWRRPNVYTRSVIWQTERISHNLLPSF